MVGWPPGAATDYAGAGSLVEREHELAVIGAGLKRIRTARSCVLIIEAVAGQGKTALVAAARRLALAQDVDVLAARAHQVEATAPYDLLRRLLAAAVERRGGPSALTGPSGFAAALFTPGATLAPGVDYGCQSLLASLADEGPVLLAVDDAHWADTDSLRVIADLATDLSDERIMVLVALRPAENPAVQPLVARLTMGETARLLQPGPLSVAGVRAVLRTAFGQEPDETFTDVCSSSSGGNVFYLREIIRPLLAAGGIPDAATANQVQRSGADALTRTVRARLAELGDAAGRLARAAATLGDDASLKHASQLAGLPYAHGRREAARLTAAAVLAQGEPIAFVHPLIRAAVEQSAEPGVIDALHARAAGVLQKAGAPISRVVQHLVAAPAAGSARVCRLLLSEARTNLETGSATGAVQLLSRALAEPPTPELRPDILLALALAERATGAIHAARAHLFEVVRSGPRGTSIAAMWELLEVLYELDDHDAVDEVHRRALAVEPYGDTPDEIRLRAILLAHAATGSIATAPPRLTDVDIGQLTARSGEERHLLICAALHRRAAQAGSEAEFLGHLRRAVRDLPADRPLTYREIFAALEAVAYLAASEAMTEADEVLVRIQPDIARLRGVAPDLQAEFNNRAILNLVRRGRFEDALAQLAGSEEFAHRYGYTIYASLGHYVRGCIALERGDYAEAGLMFLREPAGETLARALGELLSGRPAAALSILAKNGYALAPDGPVHETEVQQEPHLVASHAYSMLHDEAAALAEADRELAIRRGHGPSFRLALALRRRARFARNPHDATSLLAEAAQVCADTPRLPVRARVLASYGAALRRDGHLVEAREHLAAALDLTDRLGLTRLHDRVLADLRSAGSRVRQTRISGVESLTSSQRIVADRAAQGGTNRRIAEELYVSVKTVETHLAAVYRKLGVTGRDGLKEALATQLSGSSP
ncbi:AAA family ATPase [Actinoplanes sp. CA-051413]|uniref:AAA family ATPase n=1 Tax=Actinoplanes sp. CA-051413 TaxID=3239899 RepID=UPI003D98674F